MAPLHWATLGLMVMLAVAGRRFSSSTPEFNPACLLPNFFGLHSLGACSANIFNAPSWTISAEVLMYVGAPALLALSRLRQAFPAVMAATLIPLMLGVDWTQWTYDGGALRGLPSFLLGAILFANRARLRRIPSSSGLMGLAGAAYIIAAPMGAPVWICLLLAYAVAVLAISADLHGRRSSFVRRIAPLSRLTCPVYMLHYPLLTALASEAALRTLGLSASADVMVVIAVCLVLPGSYVAHVAFETPVRKALRKHRATRVAGC